MKSSEEGPCRLESHGRINVGVTTPLILGSEWRDAETIVRRNTVRGRNINIGWILTAHSREIKQRKGFRSKGAVLDYLTKSVEK